MQLSAVSLVPTLLCKCVPLKQTIRAAPIHLLIMVPQLERVQMLMRELIGWERKTGIFCSYEGEG